MSAVFVVLLVSASCRDDGRTLRDPPPGFEGVSISTTSVADDSDETGFDDPELDNPSIDDTFPPLEESSTGGLYSLTTPWSDGGPIDARFTCDDLNLAPALSWSPAPLGTAEIALTLEDLDAPTFVHWVIAGISPEATEIAENTVPIGAYEASNSVGAIGYTGPCPPAGSTHTYLMTVHYLGIASGLVNGVPGAELYARIATVEVASAEVAGTFSRADG